MTPADTGIAADAGTNLIGPAPLQFVHRFRVRKQLTAQCDQIHLAFTDRFIRFLQSNRTDYTHRDIQRFLEPGGILNIYVMIHIGRRENERGQLIDRQIPPGDMQQIDFVLNDFGKFNNFLDIR